MRVIAVNLAPPWLTEEDTARCLAYILMRAAHSSTIIHPSWQHSVKGDNTYRERREIAQGIAVLS